MRKKKFEITEKARVETILHRCRVGRFATNGADGYPYVIPVNYVYCRGSIYFHTAREGEKMDNLRRDSRAVFEVDVPLAYLDSVYDSSRPPCRVDQFYHSVIIRGRAEEVGQLEEKLGALNALMAAHEQRPDYNEITAEMEGVRLCTVVALRIESMTGRSNLAQSAPSEEQHRMADYLAARNLPGDSEAAEMLRASMQPGPSSRKSNA